MHKYTTKVPSVETPQKLDTTQKKKKTTYLVSGSQRWVYSDRRRVNEPSDSHCGVRPLIQRLHAFTGNSVWLRAVRHPSESEVYNHVCPHIFSSLTFAYYTFVLNWITVSVSHPARGIAGANNKGTSLGQTFCEPVWSSGKAIFGW